MPDDLCARKPLWAGTHDGFEGIFPAPREEPAPVPAPVPATVALRLRVRLRLRRSSTRPAGAMSNVR